MFEEPMRGKPFLKWAGGKGQLIDSIAAHLPNMDNIVTYVEPFIGSGAVMFWLVSNYPSIRQVVINDLNTELVNLYQSIKFDAEGLIRELRTLDSDYKSRETQERIQQS